MNAAGRWRVGFVIATSAGGTGRHVRMLADGCVARGVPAIVFGPAATGGRFGFRDGGAAFVPVELGGRPRPARDAAAVARLRRLLRRCGADVVHAHGLRAGSAAAAALAGAGARRQALVVTVHNAPPGHGAAAAVHHALERVVARRADAVLAVSADLRERMLALGARDAGLAVVPSPPAPEPPADAVVSARDELGDGGRPVVLAVGRLTEQKGFSVLLDAARWWRDRDPAPLVAIGGDGPLLPRLSERARAEGLDARFLGERGDVPALLAAADVVVVPSRWEGQPLIVSEALRSGTALVASRVGGIPDMTGEDAALLVPPGDPRRLADAVASVLDDPALRARLGVAALARAVDLPSADDAVEAALALYRRLAATRLAVRRAERR